MYKIVRLFNFVSPTKKMYSVSGKAGCELGVGWGECCHLLKKDLESQSWTQCSGDWPLKASADTGDF